MTREVVRPAAVVDDDGFGHLCADADRCDALADGDVGGLVAAFDSHGRVLALEVAERHHVLAPGRVQVRALRTAVRRFAAPHRAHRRPLPPGTPDGTAHLHRVLGVPSSQAPRTDAT